MISYESEVDIDNKLNDWLKITHIINNMFRLQKTSKKKRIKLYNALALPALLHGSEKLDHQNKRCKKNNSSRDEMCVKNSGIHFNRL